MNKEEYEEERKEKSVCNINIVNNLNIFNNIKIVKEKERESRKVFNDDNRRFSWH
jgi:hypothetical protein